MRIVETPIPFGELARMAEERFGDMVKAVVDVDRGVMAVDAEMHSDEEAALLEHGSRPGGLWGINIYPEPAGEALIEFDSMINIRPSRGNRSRGVDDAAIRARIQAVVDALIER